MRRRVADRRRHAGVGADSAASEECRDDQRRRRRRRSRVDARRHRGLSGEASQPRIQGDLQQGAGAGAPRQAQGDAGGGSYRHRPGFDGRRRAVSGHRPGPLGQGAARSRRQVSRCARQLPSRRTKNAGPCAGRGARGDVHAGRSTARIQSRQGQTAADDAAGVAGVVQGQSEPLRLRASC